MATVKTAAVSSKLGRGFTMLWTASTASNLADGIGLTAAPLLAATLTRDPGLIAGLAFAQRLPWFLFTLISGALVDRIDRRKVLLRANAVRALLLGTLGVAVFGGWVSMPLLYVIFFLIGTIETLFDNASFAILPAIVEREQLEGANSRIFTTQTVTNEFVGPPLGGTLFAWIGAVPFLLSSGAFALSSFFISLLPGQFRPTREDGAPAQSVIQSIREGLSWFLKHPLLRIMAAMIGALNFVSAASFSIFVLYAQDILGLNEAEYGILLSAGAIGGVIGGITASRIAKRFGGGVAIFISNLMLALTFLVLGFTTNPFVAGAMMALTSFSAILSNVVIISLRQSIIPDHLLGRVTSAYRLFALGTPPLGALFGGLLARQFGITAPYIVGGIALVIMAFALLPFVNNRTVAAAREA